MQRAVWCVLGVMIGLGFVGAMSAPVSAHQERAWIVPAPYALKQLAEPGAVILDTRGVAAFTLGHAPGAQRVTWQEFSRPSGPDHGELLAPAEVARRLRAKGVSAASTVLVVGDPQAWGEEGRIVWMLRAMGHERAAMVDGGHDAMVKAGMSVARGGADAPKPGDFQAKPIAALSATADEVRQAMTSDKARLLDTREAREYEGKTPYGEQRGGHVPGAKHLHFKTLMGKDGELLPAPALRARLKQAGVEPGGRVIAYCTGGIRSGWVVVVLRSLGYDAANYAGSMWQWSAQDPKTHPLQTPPSK